MPEIDVATTELQNLASDEMREISAAELEQVSGAGWVPAWLDRVYRRLHGLPEPVWA